MTKQTFQSLIAVLFIISGATGLVYQIVWFKYLLLFLGNTTFAQTIVVSTFMGGLAIGAWIWGRQADRIKRPVMLYGMLELLISIYCFFYPHINAVAKSLFFGMAAGMELETGSFALLMLKFAFSAAMLIIPTVLMGGTLPVLVKGITSKIEESGRSVSLLYFLNSFGAVLGTIMGGFIMIRLIGLEGTIESTAVLNAAISFIALFLALQNYELEEEGQPDHRRTSRRKTTDGHSPVFARKEVLAAVIVAGVSGTASMIYEVTWVRMLTPVFGSSTYSFSLMLVAFIAGITLGSLIVSKTIDRMRNTFGFLATCQFGVVVSMLLSLPLYSRIPYFFWNAGTLLARSDSTYPLYLLMQFSYCFFVMFVPTIFLGMTLPVAAKIASRSVETIGTTTGSVFSVNTIGTVIGALAGGLVLIPAIGIRHTVELAVGLNAAAGGLVLAADTIREKNHKIVIVSGVALSVLAYGVFVTDWNKLMFYSGVFRKIVKQDIRPPKSYAEFVARSSQKSDLYYKEGAAATVGVVRAMAGGVEQNSLIINGKTDASSVGDLPTQILLAQLPMMLQQHTDTALIVGFGSGVTAGSMLTHDVKRVDCVEISPEVIEASAFFNDVNNRPLDDKRMKLHLEDAHAFLALTRTSYDVIISEPSNPWIAGIGNLYSADFFLSCKEKLRSGGLMVQWFHLYEIDDEIFKLVLRTFRAAFPHTTVWHSLRNDVLLVGSTEPIRFSTDHVRSRVTNPRVSADLARIGLNHLPSILSLQSLSGKQVKDYAEYGEVNSEDRPLLEYNAPRSFFTNKGVPIYRFYDERMNIVSDDLFLSVYAQKYPLTARDKFRIALVHSDAERGEQGIAYSLLSELRKEFPKDQLMLKKLAAISAQLGRTEESVTYYGELARLRPNDPYALADYAWQKFLNERQVGSYLQHPSFAESERLFKRCVALTNDTVDLFHIRAGDMYFSVQQYGKAAQEYTRALTIRETGPSVSPESLAGVMMKASRAFYFADNLPKALEYCIYAAIEEPNNTEVKDFLYKVAKRQMER